MTGFLLLALLAAQSEPTDSESIHAIIENTEPLEAPRGDRLPLYIWPAHRLGTTNEDELVEILDALEARGLAAIASWRPNDPAALEEALQLGRLQRRLGLPISVSATSSTYAFFNGDAETAHIDVALSAVLREDRADVVGEVDVLRRRYRHQGEERRKGLSEDDTP